MGWLLAKKDNNERSARARVLGNQPESNGQRVEGVTAVPDQQGASPTAVGLVPPFIPSHDIPRGVFHIVQTTMSYALMLVIMYVSPSFAITFWSSPSQLLSGRLTLDSSFLLYWVLVWERSFLAAWSVCMTPIQQFSFFKNPARIGICDVFGFRRDHRCKPSGWTSVQQ